MHAGGGRVRGVVGADRGQPAPITTTWNDVDWNILRGRHRKGQTSYGAESFTRWQPMDMAVALFDTIAREEASLCPIRA